jgi:EAL domain-containing protein (putative c-di-GMP-specific phosphodiesterase class I)/PAS domain-containing protein
MPAVPVAKTRFGIAMAKLTPFLTAVAVLALSVMLVFTIYFTQLDLQWTAFLLGVLFAAVLSTVSQSVKAQWLLARRNVQLRRSKELLAEEVARRERAAQATKVADARFKAILDAVPAMVFFVDREERCRAQNLAFEQWCARDGADIGGTPMKELLERAAYEELHSHAAEALLGREAAFEAYWPHAEGGRKVAVKLVPYPPGAQTPSGFYAFVTTLSIGAEGAAAVDAARGYPGLEEAGDTIYLEAMEHVLSADEAPREYLLRAIEEDHFILLEQKIEPLSPEAGPANFREILLRLHEDQERTLPPGGFFEVAERYDLMPSIDRWVIRKLLKSCAAMKEADRAWRMPLYCLNVSGATVRDRGFANHVRGQLQHWDLAGSRLCFEIDHRTLNEHESEIRLLMEQLKPLGCRFTVDGFGSQKVSFTPFRTLRFDFLKIDGSIISEILKDPSELAKARAIVLACRKIGMRTIAQFVEEDAVRGKLKEIGVEYVQGFGVDRPGPLAVVAPMAMRG